MGDYHSIIPLSDAAKTKGDVAASATAIGSLFKVIPWPEIAAFLSCVYIVLRIVEVIIGWIRKPRRH